MIMKNISLMPVQRYSNACVEVSNNNFDEQKQQRL